MSDKLKYKVANSYLRIFRFVKKNQDTKKIKELEDDSEPFYLKNTRLKSKYRTLLHVIATNRFSTRLALILLDLIYVGHCSFGLYILISQKDYIFGEANLSPSITKVFPFLSILGVLMLMRTFTSIFFFLIIPYKSIRLQRRIFMKLGGGLYANAKFPMIKYRDYVMQLQRFDLLSLNEFDQEDRRMARC